MYFFRHNTVAYLIRLQNSINMTFICTGKGKNSFDSLYCNICFIVVIQNWNCNISKFCLWFLSGWKFFIILRSNSYWFLFSSFWKISFIFYVWNLIWNLFCYNVRWKWNFIFLQSKANIVAPFIKCFFFPCILSSTLSSIKILLNNLFLADWHHWSFFLVGVHPVRDFQHCGISQSLKAEVFLSLCLQLLTTVGVHRCSVALYVSFTWL